MSSQDRNEVSERNLRAYRQLDAIREFGFIFAMAAVGLKLMFTGQVALKLGRSGSDIPVPWQAVSIVGVLCLVAAGVIAAQHISVQSKLVPEHHFLRRRTVVLSAWAVGVSVVLFVVFSVGGVLSAA